jgi:hypothetical protein
MQSPVPPKPELSASDAQDDLPRRRIGLSGRLMGLSILFLLVAEILIYVPSVATFRNAWLNDRVAQARAAAFILEKAPDSLPPPVVNELLESIGTTMIALRIDQSRRLLAMSDMPAPIDFEIDLRQGRSFSQIANTFDILFFGGGRSIRVVGPAPGGGEFVEIVIDEKRLRDAMLGFSWTILQLSLAISAIVALLVFGALAAMIVRPVTQLADAMRRFRANPEDARTLVRPSGRADEIGDLEVTLSGMQASLQQQLRQKEHLANLGLAVAKINHDMRNMLSSVQLLADRLNALPDPNVQRFVPKLLSALDRAISFCQSTLAYGKAAERRAEIGAVSLAPLVHDVAELLGLDTTTVPSLLSDVPAGLTVEADAEHLGRALTNLIRNARAVLEPQIEAGEVAEIRIGARHEGDQVVIDIADNGPGVPTRIREQLFRAFGGSTSRGGTGLGLAIVSELVRGMGGTVSLVEENGRRGAVFRLTLPAAKPA